MTFATSKTCSAELVKMRAERQTTPRLYNFYAGEGETLVLQARIQYRRDLTSAKAMQAHVPTVALRDYFLPLGVDLTFAQGTDLQGDPSTNSKLAEAFCQENAPKPGSVGADAILVLAGMSAAGSHINGTLLVPKLRGVCVVYTGSHVYTIGDSEQRFEIFVHELGHLLNLTHGQANESFPTAMDSFDRRNTAGDRAMLWSNTIDEAATGYASKLRGFFGPNGRAPLGLPMSSRCCETLSSPLLSSIRPWGDAFTDDDEGAHDDKARPFLRCSLTLDSRKLSVAEPLDISVELRIAAGKAAQDVPAGLDLHTGSVVVELKKPNGTLRRYVPSRKDCSSLMRRLYPDEVIRRNYALLADEAGLLFEEPGRYQVRASVPTLGVRSRWVGVGVTPLQPALDKQGLQQFLRDGMPAGQQGGWDKLRRALASPDISARAKSHFAELGAEAGKLAPQSLKRIRQHASPRVLERYVLQRVTSLLSSAQRDRDAMLRAIAEAELVFRKCDPAHPTLEYLADLRRSTYVTDLGRVK